MRARLRAFLVLVTLGVSQRLIAQPQVTLEQTLLQEHRPSLVAAIERDGDERRGAIVFHRPYLGCAKCHASTSSTPLGPDLTQWEKSPTISDLVDSVLEPSRQIRTGFAARTFHLHDGQVIVGLLRERTESAVEIWDVTTQDLRRLALAEIAEESVSSQSIMPTGQVNGLTHRQDFLDLIRYLQAIAVGGAEKARELQPAAAMLVYELPAYEHEIDHAGMLRDWNNQEQAAQAADRGRQIYERLCVNCHGTVAQPGSLPTSLRFAQGKFKHGADPFRMYQTLTHGFGLMMPQTWMVPQQKYDVIHYIRETYLRPHNRSQYVAVDDAYLSSLPVGSTRGPEPQNVEPWALMDYGPFLMSTYEVPHDGSHQEQATDATPVPLAYKGIAVRLDSGPGGVAQGSAWMVFEHDTLRWAAGWLADETPPATAANPPRFIDWHAIHFDGAHNAHPRLEGTVVWSNDSRPGWADPQTESLEDRRIVGRDGRHYGPLPRTWGTYRGLYQAGEKVVIAYQVGETNVLECPGYEHDGDAGYFTRTLVVDRHERPLSMLVATHEDRQASVSPLVMREAAPSDVQVLAVRDRDGHVVPQAADLALHVTPAMPEARWTTDKEGGLWLHLPPHPQATVFVLRLRHYDESLPRATWRTLVERPPVDPREWLRGGPTRWPEIITTQVSPRDHAEGPLTVDDLGVPTNNPWFCQLRPTGFDFTDDGDRVIVCTWDGDVWSVSGLRAIDDRSMPMRELRWKRIASGLFQPLGLKIVRQAIYVTCRDQLVVLRDLNGDDETDFYECFNSDHQVTEHFHEFAMGLQVDAAGNFYYAKSARHALPAIVPHHGTLLRIRPDGQRTDILANGFRAANGVCLNPDGTFVVTDQEGHWNPKNRINWVVPPHDGERPRFYGNMFGYHDVTDARDEAMEPPLCWITNAFDRSPAELLWVPHGVWGSLQDRLLNLSYGYGKLFVVPHERVGDRMQGAMCELPLANFPTGTLRGRFRLHDEGLYVCGMFAWAGNATQPGGFYRIRRTAKPVYVPVEIKARSQRLELTFSEPLDPRSAERPAALQLRAWDLQRSADYGSEHHNERPLTVTHCELSADRQTLTLHVPELTTTWCYALVYDLIGENGRPVHGELHGTIHRLP